MATYTSALNLKKPAGGENVLIGDINGNMDAIDVEAIRSRANFAGTYDASSSYSVGDYCIYGGNLFRCTTAIGSGGETWTAGHWTQVAVGEELTTLNGKIASQTIKATNVWASFSQGVATLSSDYKPSTHVILCAIAYFSWDTFYVFPSGNYQNDTWQLIDTRGQTLDTNILIYYVELP